MPNGSITTAADGLSASLDFGGTPVVRWDGTGITSGVKAAAFKNDVPAFSARTTSPFSATLNTWTKIQLGTEEYDTANCFDATTNFRFTPNVAGYYFFQGSVLFASTATSLQLEIRKNNAGPSGNFQPVVQLGSASGASVSVMFYLNGSTDYVEVWGFTGSTQSISGTLQGVLVRAA